MSDSQDSGIRKINCVTLLKLKLITFNPLRVRQRQSNGPVHCGIYLEVSVVLDTVAGVRIE